MYIHPKSPFHTNHNSLKLNLDLSIDCQTQKITNSINKRMFPSGEKLRLLSQTSLFPYQYQREWHWVYNHYHQHSHCQSLILSCQLVISDQPKWWHIRNQQRRRKAWENSNENKTTAEDKINDDDDGWKKEEEGGTRFSGQGGASSANQHSCHWRKFALYFLSGWTCTIYQAYFQSAAINTRVTEESLLHCTCTLCGVTEEDKYNLQSIVFIQQQSTLVSLKKVCPAKCTRFTSSAHPSRKQSRPESLHCYVDVCTVCTHRVIQILRTEASLRLLHRHH